MVGKVGANKWETYRFALSLAPQDSVMMDDKYFMENYVYARVRAHCMWVVSPKGVGLGWLSDMVSEPGKVRLPGYNPVVSCTK